jgi:hypothetical protein
MARRSNRFGRIHLTKPDISFGRFVGHSILMITVAIALLKLRKPWERAAHLNTHGDEKIKLLKKIRDAAGDDYRVAYSS